MLIKSEGDIVLKLEKPAYYLIPAAVTLLYFLFVLLTALLEKPPSHNPDKEPKPVL